MSKIIHTDPDTGEQFEVVRDPNANGCGWLQGHVDVSHSELVSVFGAPTHVGSGDGKTQCEWDLVINGVSVSIYDWKEDRRPDRVRDWHVGGTTPESVRLVEGVLSAARKKKDS